MLFEVSKEDIRSLDDSELRELVGRLCRAEAEGCGRGAASVRYGGNQNAADGGIDVDVNIGQQSLPGGYLLAGHTVIQVKKPEMPPSAIQNEMRPKGVLRSLFIDLAREQGNYIIVSSAEDLSESMQKKRIQAMTDAVGSLAESIHMAFYDAFDLASWCNQYLPIVGWVKHKCGLDNTGWQPYENWAGSGPYLMDEARFQIPGQPELLSAESGLKRIRDILRHPGASVRLTGLSGVGKTRFAQALFENVGSDALPADKVMYLNREKSAEISPEQLINLLQHKKQRAFIIVDNCSAREHRQLTKKCVSDGSTVSVLTIEYDVQDDEPEDSRIFRMLPSSDKCIHHLLQQEFPNWPSENYYRIARLAGGNARIAVLLAKAAQNERDLNELNDSELFDRLFWQNGEKDKNFYYTAAVCALVYSFSIGQGEQESRELASLSKLIEQSQIVMRQNIRILEKKQLIQSRGNWRAVLPHALANNLAKEALEIVPVSQLLETMSQSTPHMIRSFSKRLSYLHNSPKAQEIFNLWLMEAPLSSPYKWNDVCQYRLEDAAPVVPDKVLEYLEKQCECENKIERLSYCFDENVLQKVLIRLAYEPKYFDRSLRLLVLTAHLPSRSVPGRELFQIAYSGTYTPLNQRLDIIRDLLVHPPEHYTNIGVQYLNAAMQGRGLQPPYTGMQEFGARRWDYGWRPKNEEEILTWYRNVIAFAREVLPALSVEMQVEVHKTLSANLRTLWYGKTIPVVAHCCRCMAEEESGWWQGWIELGMLKKYRWEKISDDEQKLLSELIALTKPKNLVSLTVCLLSTSTFELEPFFSQGDPHYTDRMVENELQRLAKKIVHQPQLLEQVLSVIGDHVLHGFSLGAGLAENEPERGTIWPILEYEISKRQDYSIQLGYLHFWFSKDPTWVFDLLSAVESKGMVRQAVQLRGNLSGTTEGLEHLIDLLANKKLQFSDVLPVIYNLGNFSIEDKNFTQFLKKVYCLEDGLKAAVDFLTAYCQTILYSQKEKVLSSELQSYARFLIISFMSSEQDLPHNDYIFSEVVVKLFGSDVPPAQVREFFHSVFQFFKNRNHYYDLLTFLSTAFIPLIQTHTEIFLDIAAEKSSDIDIRDCLTGEYTDTVNTFEAVDSERAVIWADSSDKRLMLANCCRAYVHDEKGNCTWSGLAQALLQTEDRLAVLNVFIDKFSPHSWINSLTPILEQRLKLIRELESVPIYTSTIRAVLPQLEEKCQAAHRLDAQEEEWHQNRFLRFEY